MLVNYRYLSAMGHTDRWVKGQDLGRKKTQDERVKCGGICILSDFDVHLRRPIRFHQS